MYGILPVEKNRTTAQVQFVANQLLRGTDRSPQAPAGAGCTGEFACSIRTLLLTRGLVRTLEYFCTISAFSIN